MLHVTAYHFPSNMDLMGCCVQVLHVSPTGAGRWKMLPLELCNFAVCVAGEFPSDTLRLCSLDCIWKGHLGVGKSPTVFAPLQCHHGSTHIHSKGATWSLTTLLHYSVPSPGSEVFVLFPPTLSLFLKQSQKSRCFSLDIIVFLHFTIFLKTEIRMQHTGRQTFIGRETKNWK